MARLLLGRRCRGQLEHVGANGFQEHAPRRRNTFLTPVGHRRWFHLAQAGDGGGSTERINDFGVGVLGIHAAIIRLALFLVKVRLTPLRGMPKSVPLRIAG